jgi:hypothetical protein
MMALDMSGMFQSANSFDSNLCTWGESVGVVTDVTDMFIDTSCPMAWVQPSFEWSPSGPFCFDCVGRNSTVDNLIEGPFPLPIVPAAVAQRPDNKIVAWSGDDMLGFDDGGYHHIEGTYTSIFDPATNAASVLRVEGAYRFRSQNFTCELSLMFPRLLFSSCANEHTIHRNGTRLVKRHLVQ